MFSPPVNVYRDMFTDRLCAEIVLGPSKYSLYIIIQWIIVFISETMSFQAYILRRCKVDSDVNVRIEMSWILYVKTCRYTISILTQNLFGPIQLTKCIEKLHLKQYSNADDISNSLLHFRSVQIQWNSEWKTFSFYRQQVNQRVWLFQLCCAELFIHSFIDPFVYRTIIII